MTAAVSRRFRHTASRSPSPVVSRASTRTASQSPEISVEVLAGQVAGAAVIPPGATGYWLVPAVENVNRQRAVHADSLPLPAAALVGAAAGRACGDGDVATRRPRMRSGAGRRSRSRVVVAAARATASARCPRRRRARARPWSRGCRVAAKCAQAACMLAASACWPGLSGVGKCALGRSNRYWSSDSCVATGGGRSGPCEDRRRVVVVELVGVGRHPLRGLLVDLQRRAGEAGVPDQRAEGHPRRRGRR